MEADWCMLPCDILGTIALILGQPDDFIRFSAVCHSWNHASSLVKCPRNPTPWLFLAENTNENPDCLRKAYDLSNNKSYRLKVPETFGTRCWGSTYGWIALQTFDYQVHLFNPLTKVRITSLPSIRTMCEPPSVLLPDPDDLDPDDLPYDSDDLPRYSLPQWSLTDEQHDFRYYVIRLVILKMPHNQHGDDDDGGNGDLLIAAIFGEFDYLAFARLGDQSWTYIGEALVMDVACCGDRVYIVRCSGQLLYCDIKGCSDLKDVKAVEYAPGFRSLTYGYDKVFILDLCGDLVMVLRSKAPLEPRGYLTEFFVVYRLDKKIKKWVAIKDIGKFSIFVGHHSSMACSISESNNCISNCIYFTDDEIGEWLSVPGFGGYDMGVYNIGSGDIIKQFYQGDDTRSSFCPPIFFMPKCRSMD